MKSHESNQCFKKAGKPEILLSLEVGGESVNRLSMFDAVQAVRAADPAYCVD